MFVWVLIIMVGGYHAGPATVPNLPTQGDCIFLGNKISGEWATRSGPIGTPFTCTRYKVAK